MSFTAGFNGSRGAIVVIPAGDELLGIQVDWRNHQRLWETLMIRKLIPAIDRRFRTRPDRAHRAIAGLSAGGFSVMHLAARHPDLFATAASFSGAVDVTYRSPDFEGALFPVLVAESACEGGGQPLDGGIFGDPVRDDVWWHNANPTDLAPNLRGMSLYGAVGNGAPCNPNDAALLANPETDLEPAANLMTHSFDAALTTAEAGHTFDYYGCGIHWWPYWQRDLHAFWPKMLHAFGDRPPPTFDFRRVDPQFSVWGWTFTADPRRAPEFVTIHHASPRGLTVTGSGTETIRTPRLFKPRARVRAAGTGTPPQTLLADWAGRLTFNVALGPPHELQQYTAAEEQAATARDYFRTRTIHLTRQHARTRLPRRAHPHRDPDNDNDHDRPGQR